MSGRLGQVLRGLWESAIRWPKIWLRLHTGSKADKNALADHDLGFTDPALQSDRDGSKAHRTIDLLVEWVKLNAQRAVKLASFVIVLLAALLAVAVVVILFLLF
jgi:hypothetical protein